MAVRLELLLRIPPEELSGHPSRTMRLWPPRSNTKNLSAARRGADCVARRPAVAHSSGVPRRRVRRRSTIRASTMVRPTTQGTNARRTTRLPALRHAAGPHLNRLRLADPFLGGAVRENRAEAACPCATALPQQATVPPRPGRWHPRVRRRPRPSSWRQRPSRRCRSGSGGGEKLRRDARIRLRRSRPFPGGRKGQSEGQD